MYHQAPATDGSPADPPTYRSTVLSWRQGDTIPLSAALLARRRHPLHRDRPQPAVPDCRRRADLDRVVSRMNEASRSGEQAGRYEQHPKATERATLPSSRASSGPPWPASEATVSP